MLSPGRASDLLLAPCLRRYPLRFGPCTLHNAPVRCADMLDALITIRTWNAVLCDCGVDFESSVVETCGVQAYGAQIEYTSLLTISTAQTRL